AAHINRATIELATQAGYEVVIPSGGGCCGALSLHMGNEDKARALARANIAAWEAAGVDAVIVNASGCGVTVKDYDHLLRHDEDWAERAVRIAAGTRDVTEWLAEVELPPMRAPEPLTVALHNPCTLQHGQRILCAPRQLLEAAGFTVAEPAEPHLCCGAAGVYSILEPRLARALRRRRTGHLEATGAHVVASANLGCMQHLAGGTSLPVVHIVELLAWAAGGARPQALRTPQRV
ncbi:MAG TPA: glycolate oxidase iron-sulfur subunit, partial [Thermopetrobacter sp.]|nr:glycolate oxidase iron-sulfur subunit [Thermopetrobacter sp.]